MFHNLENQSIHKKSDNYSINKIYNYNKFNKIYYKNMVTKEILQKTNLIQSKIISCKINHKEIKNLTYYSIIGNLCLQYNFTNNFNRIYYNENDFMREILQLVKESGCSFEIIIQLNNFKFIEFIST